MIERTFPPLNIWWVRTQKFSSKLQAECSFTHPTNYKLYTYIGKGYTSRKGEFMGNDMIDTIVIKAINNAQKSSDGSISRRNGIKLLQKIFQQDNGLVAMKNQKKESQSKHETDESMQKGFGCGYGYGYGYGFGFGFGGLLSQTKDLFDLYMDKDSDGGEKITKSEQKSIIETVQNWVKDIKELNKNINK